MLIVSLLLYGSLIAAFIIELTTIACFEHPTIPLVGTVMALIALRQPVSCLWIAFAFIVVSMSCCVQGWPVGLALTFWLIVAVLLVQFGHILHRSWVAHALVVSCIVAVFFWLV